MIVLITFVLMVAASFAAYFLLNKGMSSRARGQQLRRFLIASAVSCVPVGMVQSDASVAMVVLPVLTGATWLLTFPLLFHLTNRRSSPDYENYIDITLGLYFTGWLTALALLCAPLPWVVGLVGFVLLMVPFSQWVYYVLYGSCIDANGMKILQETHYNEIIEFVRSYRWWQVALVVMAVAGLLCCCVALQPAGPVLPWWQMGLLAVYAVAIGWYIFNPRHGLFGRTGIARLWQDIKDYSARNSRYVTLQQQRLQTLDAHQQGTPMTEPHTILLVIGESAARDHMSSFTPMEHDTTPWMRQMLTDEEHSVAFPHAYSCAMHTVQVLEKSLTEYNQYNGKQFYDSCSIVDIAHRLGYRVHWYSNQGHLGAADTPITIVAETADVARWTKQELGRVQYDEELLGYLPEVNGDSNNLLVLHLKGSHFNFMNRYPADRTVWGEAGREDYILNYENSLRYTDDVLRQAFDYCRRHLNLQAMVYCSDHATVPDRRRSPTFNGFGDTRIPLFCWMSSEWQQCHPGRFEALRQNRERYWTNDLLYELVCGVLDVVSSHYDESASLASPLYKYAREELLTFEGRRHISEDESEK